MKAEELQDWQDFLASGSIAARDQLFGRYSKWALLEALSWQQQIRFGGLEGADFQQYAAAGLLEAIGQFDPAVGVQFQSFARFRIKGAILNEVFRFSEKAAQWVAARNLGEDLQLADDTDPLRLVMARIEQLALRYLLHDVTEQAPKCWIGGQQYSSVEFDLLRQRMLAQLLALDEPEQSIMLLHYQLDVSFSDIASQLQLSKGRISQIHKQVVQRLLPAQPTNHQAAQYEPQFAEEFAL
jgi:RNA polymerase sigma factor for flagellar operon FliA